MSEACMLTSTCVAQILGLQAEKLLVVKAVDFCSVRTILLDASAPQLACVCPSLLQLLHTCCPLS